jgi:D-alanyl-D-alanine carboxypeptidase/D-alanyl-D-alanine-endopeptidase (penicillin-binding protein 4)
VRTFFIAVVTCAVVAGAAPALAVDRTLGADVPRPTVTGVPWTDAEIASLDANVDLALAGAKTLRGAHAGIYAIDARDGRVLYGRNQDDLFQPASTLKLLVGSAALDELGAGFRFRTELVANGAVENGELQGELVLRGGGDPFLNAHDLDAAADAVAKAGIARVARGIALDDTHFEAPGYPPGWSWDDFPYSYAPVVSALTFEENVVHLTVTPGDAAGAPATITAAPLGVVAAPAGGCQPGVGVRVVPRVVTGAAGATDTADVERDRAGCIHVTGTIPLGAKPDSIDAAVVSPAAYAYDAFAAALARHGVAVREPAPVPAPWPAALEHRTVPAASASAKIVWTHDSQPLRDTLADMWVPSDNLIAELLLRQLGFVRGGAPGTAEHGIAFEKSWLTSIGAGADAIALDDGSGLSGYDRITARDLVTILRHDWDGPSRALVLDDLPIAGVSGTMKAAYAGTPAEKHVFAKTGTISHVSALAGYAANAKHGAVIFAFQVDDWAGEAADLKTVRGRVLSLFVES